MMKNNLPLLYHRGKSGTLYQWRVWTENAEIFSEYGQVNGIKQLASKMAEPKNVGRSNATTAEEQALLEATAMWKFRVDRDYALTEDRAKEGVLLPMLALKYQDHKKKIIFPVDGQPKLDGVRALTRWNNGHVELVSRQGKVYENLTHITNELETCLPSNTVLDGEVYLHGMGFQKIISLVKKFRSETTQLEYHSYDMPEVDGNDSLTWEERRKSHFTFFAENEYQYIKYVPYTTLRDDAHLHLIHDQFVQEGYEGLIVRLHSGIYEYGYRSHSLLKEKSFDDGEYQVIGHSFGIGRFADCVIWRCVDSKGREFNVVPRGTLVDKRDWLVNAKSYYGKYLTVRYFGLSDDGIPRFPVGWGFRDSKDITIGVS
jgi:ATP-dependent DNA ligase